MGMYAGFFAALSEGLRPGGAADVRGGIQIPDGWEVDYWLGRPVWNKLCTWPDLEDGTVDLKMLMDMHRSLNLRDHIETEARKKAEEDARSR